MTCIKTCFIFYGGSESWNGYLLYTLILVIHLLCFIETKEGKHEEISKENRGMLSNLKTEWSACNLRVGSASGSRTKDLLRYLKDVESESPKSTASFSNLDPSIFEPEMNQSRLPCSQSSRDRSVAENKHQPSEWYGCARENFVVKEKTKTIQALKCALQKARKERDDMKKKHLEGIEMLKIMQKDELKTAASRQLGFIDKLLTDKKKLALKIETLAKRSQLIQEEQSHQMVLMKSKHESEMKKVRIKLTETEAARRKVWREIKEKEIMATTIKSLEPEIQKVLKHHRKELAAARETFEAKNEALRQALQTSKHEEIATEKMKHEERKNEALRALRELMEHEMAEALEQRDVACEQKLQLMKTRMSKQIEEKESLISSLSNQMNEKEIEHKSVLEDELKEASERHQCALEVLRKQHQDEMCRQSQTLDVELQKQMKALKAKCENEMKETLEEKTKQIIDKLYTDKKQELHQLKHDLKTDNQKSLAAKEFIVAELKIRIQELEESSEKLQKHADDERVANEQLSRSNRELKESLEILQHDSDKCDERLQSVDKQLSEQRRALIDNHNQAMLAANAERSRVEKDNLTLKEALENLQCSHELRVKQLQATHEATNLSIHQRIKQTIETKEAAISQLKCLIEERDEKLRVAETLLEKQRDELINKD